MQIPAHEHVRNGESSDHGGHTPKAKEHPEVGSQRCLEKVSADISPFSFLLACILIFTDRVLRHVRLCQMKAISKSVCALLFRVFPRLCDQKFGPVGSRTCL